jgi:hypothetical protein
MSTLMAEPSRRVDAVLAGVTPQRRVTVLFRLILAIPILFVAFFVAIAFVVVMVIGWFAALFMGRLPQWAHDFLSDVVRFFTRIQAYLLLLTDRYPPFSFEDTDFPVRPLMPPPGRLNRWAVLFRLVLLVPAAAFLQIVQYGLTFPLLFVAWLIVLVRGEMPQALYDPYAAMVRYGLRLSAYECMVTSEYAWGMLGDRTPPPYVAPLGAAPLPPVGSGTAEGEVWTPPSAPTSQSPPQYPPPQYPPPQYPPPQYPPPQAAPGTGVPPPPAGQWERFGAPVDPSSAGGGGRTSGASLVLTGAARGWMIFAIVWGSVLFVGQSAFQDLATNNRNDAAAQYNTVVSDYNSTTRTLLAAGRSVPNCQTVACARPYDTAAASSLNAFGNDLGTMDVTGNASGAQQHVESDVAQLSSTLTQLAHSASAADYARTAQRSDLNGLVQTYVGDVRSLVDSLRQAANEPF